MDTTFSMVRVRNVMRRDLIENWKSNLYGLLGIFAALFFPMLGLLWSAEDGGETSYPEIYSFYRFCGNMLGVIFALLVLLCFLCFPNYEMHGQQGETYLLFAASGYEAGKILFTGGICDHRYFVDGAGSLVGIGTYSLPVAAFV